MLLSTVVRAQQAPAPVPLQATLDQAAASGTPGPIRKILTHLGEPLEPPPISPARGPPTDWGELVQVHNECDVTQASPDELPVIDIHSL
jgi:hypothetical protein